MRSERSVYFARDRCALDAHNGALLRVHVRHRSAPRRGGIACARMEPVEAPVASGKQDLQAQQNEMQRLPETITVVIADDHPLVRSGIRSLLKTIPQVRVLADVGDGTELLRVLGSLRPDIVITDISMPGIDGLEALARIRSAHPQVRVIVLSMHDSPDVVRRAIGAGAVAYLRKDAGDFELASAIENVMTTGSYISADIAKTLMEPGERRAEDDLTERQIQILKLLALGRSSKEIAFELGLSPKTVDVHRARIMDRLNVRDVASLTMYAVRKGLVKL
jgi:two-component system, NarL family, nitrate/nitrite response regulator NarL